MFRIFAFFVAVALTALSVTTSCLASAPDDIRFTLQPSSRAGQVQLNLQSGSERHHNSMGSSFAVGELQGLDLAALRAGGRVRFALVREAGRVDCAGTGANNVAAGTCRFAADAGFAEYLARRGIKRPTREQSYHLTMVEAGRPLVEAIRAARYAAPDLDKLTALAAVGVTPAYIADLSRRGYKPASLDDLVQFRALGVTGDFIAGFERLGYRGLPAHSLVELKALDVTPQYVTELRQAGIALPSAEQLVKLRAVGFSPGGRR